MHTYDLTPLFRSAIGFDRLARSAETARAAAESPAYPPYNIEKTAEDVYVLTMAVAGFGPEEIDVTLHQNTLIIAGKAAAPQAPENRRVLYRGIAGRAFERRFALADHLVVEAASLEHGMLYVALKREVPEALKPRRIAIESGTQRLALAA